MGNDQKKDKFNRLWEEKLSDLELDLYYINNTMLMCYLINIVAVLLTTFKSDHEHTTMMIFSILLSIAWGVAVNYKMYIYGKRCTELMENC